MRRFASVLCYSSGRLAIARCRVAGSGLRRGCFIKNTWAAINVKGEVWSSYSTFGSNYNKDVPKKCPHKELYLLHLKLTTYDDQPTTAISRLSPSDAAREEIERDAMTVLSLQTTNRPKADFPSDVAGASCTRYATPLLSSLPAGRKIHSVRFTRTAAGQRPSAPSSFPLHLTLLLTTKLLISRSCIVNDWTAKIKEINGPAAQRKVA